MNDARIASREQRHDLLVSGGCIRGRDGIAKRRETIHFHREVTRTIVFLLMAVVCVMEGMTIALLPRQPLKRRAQELTYCPRQLAGDLHRPERAGFLDRPSIFVATPNPWNQQYQHHWCFWWIPSLLDLWSYKSCHHYRPWISRMAYYCVVFPGCRRLSYF